MVKISPVFKRVFYTALSISWLSGVLFFIMNTWLRVPGDFGPVKHPWQFNVLVVHGAGAFLMLMLLGAIIANHIPLAWRTGRLRLVGVSLLIWVLVQTITALMLYYMGNESLRAWVVYVHLGLGVCLPLMLIGHLKAGVKKNKP